MCGPGHALRVSERAPDPNTGVAADCFDGQGAVLKERADELP